MVALLATIFIYPLAFRNFILYNIIEGNNF